MKAMQIMTFIILIFASFYLLSATGIFFNMETFDNPDYFRNSVLVSLITGFSIAVVIGLAIAKFGGNPYVTTAIESFIGFFWGCSTSLFTLLNLIAAQFGAMFQGVMASFTIVINVIFVLLTYYALIQMSVGGAKGYE